MNIQILDSWLREHIVTNAKPSDIAKCLSLASASVERTEKVNNDYLYDIEVTTNRVDMMSVVGIARELSAVLPQFGFNTQFTDTKTNLKITPSSKNDLLSIEIDKSLVHRVTAVVLEVKVNKSPKIIQDRLESSGIRSLNNVIDVTNYIMREAGHPAHVFDFDRLHTQKLFIRAAKKGELITTLDGNTYELPGGDIVAEDDTGRIVDLLGIMGLENSVVTNDTKRVLLFFDNNNASQIRKTSLALGIRTEAAILNEKGVDPELIAPTLNLGIELYKKYADGKIVSDIIDIYPNKPKLNSISLRKTRISEIIGVEIKENTVISILNALSFEVKNERDNFIVSVPSFRNDDIEIEEDVVEEIARIYGYHKIPDTLPPITHKSPLDIEKNEFYWEERVKNALKYWGFNETYTYSMVSEDLFEGPLNEAVKIANPLSLDHVFMRKTLVPSILEVIRENNADEAQLFELSKVYLKNDNNLPHEVVHLAGVVKRESNILFYELKGVLEQLFTELGIKEYQFKKRKSGGTGADIYIGNKQIGEVEILDDNLVNFEIDFEQLLNHASNKKVYTKVSEYPPIIEDLRVELIHETPYEEIIDIISSQSSLIKSIILIDEYKEKKTFRINYQSNSKNLTNEDIKPIRKKIEKALTSKLRAKLG